LCAPCDRSGRSARPEVAPGLTPDSMQQKYAQMVASTWITPGCVQFLKNKKRFHTAWTHKRHAAKRCTRLISRRANGDWRSCSLLCCLSVRCVRAYRKTAGRVAAPAIGCRNRRRESSTADLLAYAALRFRPYGPSPIYWITRSARLSTSGGIVMPMSRAVLRFTISS
jgi:hypothetical protein